MFKKYFTLMMAALLLLSACGTVVQPSQPTQPPAVEPSPNSPGVETPGTGEPMPTTQAPAQQEGEQRGNAPYEPYPQADPAELAAFSEAQQAFALAIYQKLASGKAENLILSPYSIYQALLMTYAGAAGETKAQMQTALQLPVSDESVHRLMNALTQANLPSKVLLPEGVMPFELRTANALWGQVGFSFLQTFLDTLSKHYDAPMHSLDFAKSDEATDTINNWVAEHTADKIQNIIPKGALGEDTRLVLTNAIYFKGSWQRPFLKENTLDAPFYPAEGKTVTVSMMHQTAAFEAVDGEGYQAILLPYQGGTKAMLIVLPDGGLNAFNAGLDLQKLQVIRAELRSQRVQLSMPRFKVETQFDLNQAMSELGMPAAFDAQAADFSGMTGDRSLMIGNILHKAFADVNEDGTEAAAATAVVMELTSAPVQEDPLTITLDRPFYFAIIDDENGSVLFNGQVVEP